MTDSEKDARIADLESVLVTLSKEVTAVYIESLSSPEREKVLQRTFREMKRLGIKG